MVGDVIDRGNPQIPADETPAEMEVGMIRTKIHDLVQERKPYCCKGWSEYGNPISWIWPLPCNSGK